jgi:hypothetical protein
MYYVTTSWILVECPEIERGANLKCSMGLLSPDWDEISSTLSLSSERSTAPQMKKYLPLQVHQACRHQAMSVHIGAIILKNSQLATAFQEVVELVLNFRTTNLHSILGI